MSFNLKSEQDKNGTVDLTKTFCTNIEIKQFPQREQTNK